MSATAAQFAPMHGTLPLVLPRGRNVHQVAGLEGEQVQRQALLPREMVPGDVFLAGPVIRSDRSVGVARQGEHQAACLLLQQSPARRVGARSPDRAPGPTEGLL